MLKIAWSPIYQHVLPNGHRFPMEKYSLLPDQLLYEGTVQQQNFFKPDLLPENLILQTHKQHYWEKLKYLKLSKSEVRKTGFPLSKLLVEREICIAQGTVDCTNYALSHQVALNIAGGTHHAFTDRGEGFCLLNDQAIAANYLLQNRLANRILIIDLDVHQGNGTAEIFQNEPRVFTFSMHGENNYPLKKEKSDLDVPLADGTDDATYLSLLNNSLSKIFNMHTFDFVFYQSGVDILSTDKLGKLSLSIQACKERDKLVFEYVKEANLPLVVCMGGGYSHRISHIIEAHANTFRLAQEFFF